MPKFFSEVNVTFRPARVEDFDALYEIWMQDHILPFMSFEKMSKDEFHPIFMQIFNASHVYVIEENDKVVAVRRIVYGSGDDAHTAYFCSFGVDQAHTNRGYGTMFYQKFIELLRFEHHEIRRIELGQETDNPSGALYLANKFGFNRYGVFPEWQPRLTGSPEYVEKWLVAERFFERILDETILEQTKDSPAFSPVLPTLKALSNDLEISKHGDKVLCHYEGHLVATCKIENGVRRFGHIQFWSLELEDDCNMEIAEQFLRKLALDSKEQFKKVEIFSSDEKVIHLLEKIGFHYRGKKTAGRLYDGHYYNKTGADFGFYNINDARLVLSHSKQPSASNLDDVLTDCQNAINEALNSEKIDAFGASYLENMAFQMVREVHSENLYQKDNAPWMDLVQSIPVDCSEIKDCLINLANSLGIKLSLSSQPSPS